MYKQLFLLLFSTLTLLPASAQVSVEKLFQTMPDDLLWLDQSQRKELLAYFKDKKVDSIANGLNGYCKIVDFEETAQHISVNTSQKGNLTMQILGSEAAPFIGIISTVYAPAHYSTVLFYSTDWKPITLQLPSVSASDFLAKGLSAEDQTAANRLLTPLFVQYSFQKGANTIIARCDAKSFLSETDAKQLQPLLQSETLSIAYKDGEWKIIK